MNFIFSTHISNRFTESNIKVIRQVEVVQNYKISEIMGTKLQHDPEKVIYKFSSYDLTETEISLLLKGMKFSLPLQKLKFENSLLPYELIYRGVISDEKKDDDVQMHLKSKIEDHHLKT